MNPGMKPGRKPAYRRMLLGALLALAPLALVLGPAPLSAQETNPRDLPIHLQADHVTLDDRAGVSTYRGNVVLTQGELRVEADEVRVETAGREVVRMLATGAPAHFQDTPVGQPTIYADATSVEYRARDGLVILVGDARLRQGEDRVAGHRIEYDHEGAVVRASGRGEERVRAVLHPREGGADR